MGCAPSSQAGATVELPSFIPPQPPSAAEGIHGTEQEPHAGLPGFPSSDSLGLSKGLLLPRTLENVYAVQWDCVLGRGHYGKVYKGSVRASGQPVAVKVLSKSGSRPERLTTERDILAHLASHPSVVTLLDTFDTAETVVFVLEYVPGGELFEHLISAGPLTERDAATMVLQLADCLRFLHSEGIVHRDIKPENLLLTERVVAAPPNASSQQGSSPDPAAGPSPLPAVPLPPGVKLKLAGEEKGWSIVMGQCCYG